MIRLFKMCVAGIVFAVIARSVAVGAQFLFGLPESTTDYLAGLLNGSFITLAVSQMKEE